MQPRPSRLAGATSIPWLVFLALAVLLPTGLEAQAAERLPIVDRAIEHHGGDLYQASRVRLRVCSKSGCYRVESTVEGDRFEHLVEGAAREGRRRVRITNDEVERWRDGTPVPVAAEDAQGLRDWAMARVYFPFLPYRLNDPGVFKTDLGTVTWEGRELARVKVTFTPGSSTDADDEYLYWLDPESGEVAYFAYSYAGDPGGLRFRRGRNYRRVGGLLFFDQENLGAEGDDLRVEQIDPEFVAGSMRPVSVVELHDVEVESLAR